MHFSEEGYRNLEGLDGSVKSSGDMTGLLLDTIKKRNWQAVDAGLGLSVIIFDENLHELPVLETPDFGNQLTVRIKPKDQPGGWTIPFGYFSPIDGRFVVYPENMSEDEIEAVAEEALILRDHAIIAFDGLKSTAMTRYDLAHEAVRCIHTDNDAFLNETDLLVMITDADNAKRHPANPNAHVRVDGFTQATFCLRPDPIKRKLHEHIASIKCSGSFTRNGDFILRRNVHYTDFSERDETTGEPLEHKPKVGLVNADDMLMVSDKIFDLMATSALMEVIDNLVLDTEKVGIEVRPTGLSS